MGHGYNINITAWRADEGVLFFLRLSNEMCLCVVKVGVGLLICRYARELCVVHDYSRLLF